MQPATSFYTVPYQTNIDKPLKQYFWEFIQNDRIQSDHLNYHDTQQEAADMEDITVQQYQEIVKLQIHKFP